MLLLLLCVLFLSKVISNMGYIKGRDYSVAANAFTSSKPSAIIAPAFA